MQVAQSLQRRSRAAEANGSEAGSQMQPPAANIWNGLECKLSTQSSKVCPSPPVAPSYTEGSLVLPLCHPQLFHLPPWYQIDKLHTVGQATVQDCSTVDVVL